MHYVDNSGLDLETRCTGDFNGNVECCINDVFCFQETCGSDEEDVFTCNCTAKLNNAECSSCEACESVSFGVACCNAEQGSNVGS